MKRTLNPKTRIREVRKARGYTLAQVAKATGTTPQTISRLETDDMTVSVPWLEKIGAALGVDPYALMPNPDLPTTPDGLFLRTLGDAVIHNRRAVPAIEDVLPAMVESLGKLSGRMLECRKGLRPWDDAYEQALAVAAAAMRIGVDGKAFGGKVKLGEAA